ncbi:MAG: hypothetical protein Q9219_000166 [cf. Caloplaca sp. 3 TL-2023]
MAASVRTRLYREFLTPTLHRRFTQAAGISFLICYVEAVLIGDKSSYFWSWFPIGKAGIRTLLLLLSPLLVFILRVAQLHFGDRSTASSFQTFTQYLHRREILETTFCYVFSALLFSEIYIWSVPTKANLNWVVQGRSWERQRLNERPIYLRSLYLGLALLQAVQHLGSDYDRIRSSLTDVQHRSPPNAGPSTAINPIERMKSSIIGLLQEIGFISLGSSILGPIIYSLTVRQTAWRTSLACARFLRWDIPTTAELSYIPPYHYTLVFRSLFSGFCLLLLWRASNLAFSAYVAQEPLKRGQPLTQESHDPNGSLINGLKSRKQVTSNFAFWELAQISKNFPERRIAIFKDIDRPAGPAWSQISTECLKLIQGVTTRISDYEKGSTPQQTQFQPEQLQSLPRLGAPLREESVFMNSPMPSSKREMVESKVGTLAKSYGSSPAPADRSPALQTAKYYTEAAQKRLLSPGQQQMISPARFRSVFHDYLTYFLQSRFGKPFRQTFARRVRLITFGTPFSDATTVVDAIDSLTALTKASIKEDIYGKVAKDVSLILRTFIMTHQSLERLTRNLGPHWTDVDFEDGNRRVEDVEVVLGSLRYGLGELAEGFGAFAKEIGLLERDLRVARALSGK